MCRFLPGPAGSELGIAIGITRLGLLDGVERSQPNGALGELPALVSPRHRQSARLGGVRARPAWQSALRGVNAAVVGLLPAALYNPIWTSKVGRPLDPALVPAAFGLLVLWRLPPWLVVGIMAVVGAVAAHFG